TSSLVLNYDGRNPFDAQSTTTSAQLASTYVATQLDIIRSQKVALKVVDKLGLHRNPGWREAYAATDPNPTPIREWIAQQIMANLEAEQQPNNSRVVTVSYTASSPTDAAQFANAYAQAFVATALELTVEPTRRNAPWWEQQLKSMRARLDESRANVTELQSQRGVVSLDDKLGAESARLDDISRNLVQAQMATAAARARQLGQNHPEYQAALQQERALAGQYEAQKRNILRLQGQRDGLDTLLNEVNTQEQNYEATLQAYFKSAMESQFNQTNIAILSPATPPSEPSSPNIPLNMISAVVLGLFLGIVGALISEMANPKVRRVWSPSRFLGEPLTEFTRDAA
ncbi:MAG: chain length determinant protein EpsF, partial [Steroidobacteraceae bacterium]|nr:chain length determinant protein EpsF [Steroidobacteraceae bacterium]